VGKKKPVSFGDLHFRTQTEARNYLNAMLNRYEAAKKIGSGIKSFSVRSADYGSKCFWVNRTDGTTEKFSHKACV
jgi:hypothetical protein